MVELSCLGWLPSPGDVVLVNEVPAARHNRTQGVTPWLCEHTEDLTADRTHLVETHTGFASSVLCKIHNRKPPPCLPDGLVPWNAATLNMSRLQQHTTQRMGLVMLGRDSQTRAHRLYVPFHKKLKNGAPLKVGHYKPGLKRTFLGRCRAGPWFEKAAHCMTPTIWHCEKSKTGENEKVSSGRGGKELAEHRASAGQSGCSMRCGHDRFMYTHMYPNPQSVQHMNKPDVNYGLWMKTCQRRSISYDKGPVWWGHWSGEAMIVWGDWERCTLPSIWQWISNHY